MLALATLAAANPAARADVVRLVDVTGRTGIEFRHRLGSAEKDWIAEVNGGGVALLDYDGDGDLDIYLVNGGRWAPDAGEPKPRNALFRNEGSWRFTDVTKSAGVGDEGWGSGVAVADVEGRGAGATARRDDLVGETRQGVGPSRREDHVRSVGGKTVGEGRADPRGRAGQEDDLRHVSNLHIAA